MERRKYPRVCLKRGVLWRSAATLDNLDHIRNISEGGLCIAMEALRLSVEEVVHVELYLPTQVAIRAQARVCWVGPGGVNDLRCRAGLEFVDVRAELRNELRHFVGMQRYGCD